MQKFKTIIAMYPKILLLLMAVSLAPAHGASSFGAHAVDADNSEDAGSLSASSFYLPSIDFQERLAKNEVSGKELELLLDNIVPKHFQAVLKNLRVRPIEDLKKLLEDLISPECLGLHLEFVYRLNNIAVTLQNSTWALQMIDSWGKIPEGILQGHVNSMGDFDECVDIHEKDLEPYYSTESQGQEFRGKFCNVIVVPTVMLPKTSNDTSTRAVDPAELIALLKIDQGVRITPSISVCFPSVCSNNDINVILNTTVFDQSVAYTTVYTCDEQGQRKLVTGDWVMIGVLAVIGLLILVGTLLDGFTARNRKASANKDGEKPKRKPGTGQQVLLAFSVITNIRKWQTVGSGAGQFGCLHGLRFMSTLYVVLAHTWYMTIYMPWWNMVDVKTVQEDWTILTILNATLAVDTFFVMGGMLVAYNLLKMFDKSKGKLNYAMFIVHRYLRLTPTYAILVGIMATIFPYVGSGPYWGLMTEWGRFCRDHWWTNILYINNLVYPTEICQAEAWYLSDDMQFYIFTPLFIYPLWRWKFPGMGLLGVLSALAVLAPGLQVYYLEVPPTLIGSRRMGTMYQDIYIKPWARVQTYIVGIWLGYIVYLNKGKKVQMPKLLVLGGWLASTGFALAVLYGIYPWFDPMRPIPAGASFVYASLHRVGWGVSISWIIYACINGSGGYVNNFLSWSPFIPLGRLSFCTYLVSLHIQTILHLTFRQPMHYDGYVMTNLFFAHVVMSVLAGFVCTIAFESPFIHLEKLLFAGAAGNNRPQQLKKPPQVRHGIFYNTTDAIIKGTNIQEDNSTTNNNNEVQDKPDV